MVVDGAVVMVENILRHLGRHEDAARSIPDRIRAAAHEVQRPVFYAITIIITAYLPIFTLQKVEGRIFRPMAWTVAFALVGALVFSILVAPVAGEPSVPPGTRDWENPLLRWITRGYRRALTWTRASSLGDGRRGGGGGGLQRLSSLTAARSARSSFRTSTKAPSGRSARPRPASDRPKAPR